MEQFYFKKKKKFEICARAETKNKILQKEFSFQSHLHIHTVNIQTH